MPTKLKPRLRMANGKLVPAKNGFNASCLRSYCVWAETGENNSSVLVLYSKITFSRKEFSVPKESQFGGCQLAANSNYQVLFVTKSGNLIVMHYQSLPKNCLRDVRLLYLDVAKFRVHYIPLEKEVNMVSASRILGVTVTKAVLSPSETRIAVCLQFFLEHPYHYEMYKSSIIVFDFDAQKTVFKLEPHGYVVWPSVAFYYEDDITVASILPGDSKFTVTMFDIPSGCQIFHATPDVLDATTDAFSNIFYSLDGCYAILVVMGNSVGDHDITCQIYALDADTGKLVKKYPVRYVYPCHWECLFNAVPQFSTSGESFKLGFPYLRDEDGNSVVAESFHLPKVLNLKHVARRSILNTIRTVNDVEELPVYHSLREYLHFR